MATPANPKEECIVAFDSGTQSIRAAVVDLRGNILDIVRTPLEPYFSKNPGWAEQDPGYYWDKFCETSRRITQSEHFDPEAIKGVVVTTQRGTYINVDERGEALRPAIVWLDQRRAGASNWAPPLVKWGLKALGLYNNLDRYNRQCYANWIREHQPEIWARTHKFLLISGFFNFKLTGAFVESRGSNTGYLETAPATILYR